MNPEKITLKLKLGDDFRRIQVTKSTTYADFVNVVQNLYHLADASFSCKWTDEEGDACTVSCDEELFEAIYSAQANLLRIDVSVTQPAKQPHTRTSSTWAPRCSWRQRATRREEWSELGAKGIQMMDQHDYVAARELFEQQAQLSSPWQRSIPLYNIACCDSLLGNTDSALAFLARSIDAGYRDLHHMERDKDLINIRDLPGYKILVADLKEQVPTPSPVHLFNLARCQSILGNMELSMSLLQKAAQFGFSRLNTLLGSKDLAPLRELEPFKAVLAQVEQNLAEKVKAKSSEAEKPEKSGKKSARLGVQKVAPAQTTSDARPQVAATLFPAVPTDPIIPLQTIFPAKLAPIQPEVAPVEPEAAPVEPEAAPLEPKAAPLEPKAAPLEPKAAPLEPKAVPLEPKIAPLEPKVDPSAVQSSATLYIASLNVLHEMGFQDHDANIAALASTNGDVVQAIALLIA